MYIYKFIVNPKRGSEKKVVNEFMLSAESESKLYQRANSQYGVTKDRIVILERIGYDDNVSEKQMRKEDLF